LKLSKDAPPEEILAYVGRMMFERRLTDFAGGNISMRLGDTIYISPRFSGGRQHWDIDPATIVSGDIYSDEVMGNPMFSREGKAHLSVYRAFQEAAGIIHAHPFYVLPFAAAGKAIHPVLEDTEKFGVIEPVAFAPAHSVKLAENIVACLKAQRERITRHAAAVLLPRHGIFAVSKDILLCLDAVERINWNAWCILAQKMIPDAPAPPVEE
jgi:L-fuculose-phosphate aldolase